MLHTLPCRVCSVFEIALCEIDPRQIVIPRPGRIGFIGIKGFKRFFCLYVLLAEAVNQTFNVVGSIVVGILCEFSIHFIKRTGKVSCYKICPPKFQMRERITAVALFKCVCKVRPGDVQVVGAPAKVMQSAVVVKVCQSLFACQKEYPLSRRNIATSEYTSHHKEAQKC